MTLNTKQQVFVEQYLVCWNSSEAARRAGYNGKANVIGPRLLADVSIKAMIEERVAELVMSADEALILLSDQARASLGDFAKVQVLADLEGHPKARLVKALASDVYEDKAGKVHYKARIELHDTQSAIINVLKIHGRFTDRVEVSGKVELDHKVNAALKIAWGIAPKESDADNSDD